MSVRSVWVSVLRQGGFDIRLRARWFGYLS